MDTIILKLALLASGILLSYASIAQSTQKASVLEITSFQLLPEADEQAFLRAAKQMEAAFLSDQDGFIERVLVKDEAGTWTDVVKWRNKETFSNAMQAAEKSESAGNFMQYINFDSVKMQINDIKLIQ